MDWGRLGAGVGTFGMSEGGGLLSAGGGITGMLRGGRNSPIDMQDMLNRRQSEIENFRNQLEMTRGGLMDRMKALQSSAYNRFIPNLEAKLAGRGLSAGGGAFNSAAARAAAEMQGQYDMTNADWTRQDMYKVADLQAGMFQPSMANAFSVANQNRENSSRLQNALGGLGGSAFNAGLNYFLPPGGGQLAAMMSKMGQGQGRSVFGGGNGIDPSSMSDQSGVPYYLAGR